VSRDEARQHIRAAQEAEVAGNKEGAVLHLQRAALIFVRAGQHAMAAKMYRNCIRLAPERADLHEALKKAEEWAKPASSPTPSPVEVFAADDEAPTNRPIVTSDGFDALAIPRGPTLIPEGTEAWCSFCCRPTAEIGELVAGPAGAFICTGCITACLSLLSMGEVDLAPPVRAIASPAAPATPAKLHLAAVPVERLPWVGSEVVLRAARAALLGVGPAVVVVGPEGCGKSALLETLSLEHLDAERVVLGSEAPIPSTGPLLVEHLDRATAAQRAALAGRALVGTWRADAETDPLLVTAGETSHLLPFALGPTLPPELSGAIALALPAASPDLLHQLLAQARVSEPIDLAPALTEALVARAVKSGRGAKGLLAELALLRAVPPGGPLGIAAPPKRSRKKRT
jgi:hypothetical protein